MYEYQAKFVERFMADFPYCCVDERPSKRLKTDNAQCSDVRVAYFMFTAAYSKVL